MLRSILKFRFCFRFRREWQQLCFTHQANLSGFCNQINKIQNKLDNHQKIKFFDLISKKKKLVKELFKEQPIKISFANTVMNWNLWDLRNKEIEQQIETGLLSLDEILTEIKQLQTHLDEYFCILKQFLQNKLFIDKIKKRFSILQQAITRVIVSNYAEKKENNPFQNKTKFKQDVAYEVSQLSSQDIVIVGQILKVFSNFNLFSKKLMIISQLLPKKYFQGMGDEIYNYLFVLAHIKTGIKSIESELLEIIINNNSKSYIQNLYSLYYFAINQVNHFILFSELIRRINALELNYQSLNINELRMIRYLQTWLASSTQKYPSLQLASSATGFIKSRILQFYSLPSSQEKFFKRFITKQAFKFSQKIDEFYLKPVYIMSSNVFFFVDHRDIGMNDQETGLQYLGKDYYKIQNIKIKTINASQTSRTETRRKEIQYFWSKLKKEERATKLETPLYYQY